VTEALLFEEIRRIEHGGVNCYLLKAAKGFFLIDSGFAKNRAAIEADLQNSGCTPGNLNLIILTHGDFDHSGNCKYFREKFGAKIVMHPADCRMVKAGDLFCSRKSNALMRGMGKLILVVLNTQLKEEDRFTPDVCVEDGFDLSVFGLHAKVIHIPGHSFGSIGILSVAGDFFCGDLLENKKQPARNSLMPDKQAFNASIEKLKALKIGTTYPGHGEPFKFEQFLEAQSK
jgi:glyoxylase-like metal-dependent hydrolase (beta-lactamase superfamily II)